MSGDWGILHLNSGVGVGEEVTLLKCKLDVLCLFFSPNTIVL